MTVEDTPSIRNSGNVRSHTSVHHFLRQVRQAHDLWPWSTVLVWKPQVRGWLNACITLGPYVFFSGQEIFGMLSARS